MREKLKKIKFFRKIAFYIKKLRFYKEYNIDYKYFIRNYVYSHKSRETIGYDILLLVHSLEKGMSNKSLRPFGREKVIRLIGLIKEYSKYGNSDDYEYIVAVSALREYVDIYKDNGWQEEEYKIVEDYLRSCKNIKQVDVGCQIIKQKDFINVSQIDYVNFLSTRHSAREYSNQKLLKEDIEYAVNAAILSPSACNRQMCKVYYLEDKKCKEIVFKMGQGFGNFEIENANLFVITFDLASFYFIGERNQGWLNAGLFSMNFVNALHSKNIGSCFIQFGNSNKQEIEMKKALNIPDSERIAVIISAGYYEDEFKTPFSHRKEVTDIYIKI